MDATLQTAKSLAARAHRGATRGAQRSDPRPLELVRGSMYKKKGMQDLSLNRLAAATICKESFDPSRKKNSTRVWGSNQKMHWGVILSPKMMSSQGVEHPIAYIAVCGGGAPKNEGYVALTHVLDLTTSVRGEFSTKNRQLKKK